MKCFSTEVIDKWESQTFCKVQFLCAPNNVSILNKCFVHMNSPTFQAMGAAVINKIFVHFKMLFKLISLYDIMYILYQQVLERQLQL